MRRLFLPVARTSTSGGSSLGPADAPQSDAWRAFFMRTVVVPPPRFRPPTRRAETSYEHPQNVYLTQARGVAAPHT